MRLSQPDMRQSRSTAALFVIVFTIAMLLTGFFHTQVIAGEQYAVRGKDNRLRPIPIPAPRGTIYDRYGEIVATSVAGYSVHLLPGSDETVAGTLRDVAVLLGLTDAEIQRLRARRNADPHGLLQIAADATFAQVAALQERRTSFPNLLIVEYPKRYYPAGAAIGHVVGYVAEISPTELELPEFEEAGYAQGQWIGKAGIERAYELLLSGRAGARFVEVDAMGRVIEPRRPVEMLPPVPGEDLHLSLDLGLQKYLRQIFPDTMKGAVAVMAPSTGEVLALYSHPSYDPNDFVGGPSLRLWQALVDDARKPLLHRAVAALYPPGSTWKLATAAIGLSEDLVEADSRMPVACTGGLLYAGRYARCWYAAGHGSLDLVGAIENSCNVYFYQLGIRMGLTTLVQQGTRLGFSSRTGIDLPGEEPGIFPASLEWYEERFGHEPTPSEVMSLAIGQGPNSQTVLRMAHFYSAIAGNGTAPEPFLGYPRREESGEGALVLDLGSTDLAAIWEGLRQVVERGTARLSALGRWQLYGKTGTSQNPHGDDHGWFVGFAGPRGEPPEVVVAAVIEHGLHGSDVAPIAAKAAEHYLSRKYGLPFDPAPTLIERLQTGRASWSELQ